MEGNFKAARSEIIELACGCCSESEWQEEEFKTLQDAYDYVSNCYFWKIYLDGVLILEE
jgi:hypothetical protein